MAKEKFGMDSSVDRYMFKMCGEIDYWKSMALGYKQDFEDLQVKHNELLRSSIAHSQTMIGHVVNLVLTKDITDKKELLKVFPDTSKTTVKE